MAVDVNQHGVAIPTAEMTIELIRIMYPSIKQPEVNQITLDLVSFMVTSMRRLKVSSTLTLGLFKLYKPFPPTSVVSITLTVARAATEALKSISSEDLRWNMISYYFIVLPQQRFVSAHLSDPDTFPCPAYAIVW